MARSLTVTPHADAFANSLVILSDLLGAIGLIVGLGTRFAAAGTVATMLGAILLWHLPNGFFMNWGGTQAGEGFEFHLLALGLAIPLALRGGGSLSLDNVLQHWLRKAQPETGSDAPAHS